VSPKLHLLPSVPESVESPGDGWLERLRQGDAQAFRELFIRYSPRIRRFLGDLLKSPSAADEGTQETFVRAHARLGSLKESAKLTSWLFGIARNVAYEQRRQWRGSTRTWDVESEADLAIDAVLPAPNPETLALGRESEQRLSHALELLAPARRAALVLRLDHGLAYDEIAEVMDWTLAQVKNEIHRGRIQLRLSLAAYLGGEE
jgi:RNA polymerase sigma-70 factor, ECF subfamily